MIANLLTEYPLRGGTFEYIANVITRRKKEHNYVFLCRQFDSFSQLIARYELDCSDMQHLDFIEENWRKTDLIEFIHIEKNVQKIAFYDVKTKHFKVKRNSFEFCQSNYDFMCEATRKGFGTHIISMILFENWRYSYNIFDFKKVNCRIYQYRKKKS